MPPDRIRTLQRAGYRCEVTTDGYTCARPAGFILPFDGRVLAVCLLHRPAPRRHA